VLELYPEAAPKTVKNFLQYVKSGHYSGTIFHRVIPNFMIQGGGMTKNMQEKPVLAPIPLEAAMALEHGLKNDAGTVAMARTQDPDSATAQFFINVANNTFLNHQRIPEGDPVQFTQGDRVVTAARSDALLATAGYTTFGKVIQGMDVVNQIKDVETHNMGMNQDVPVHDITILSAVILKN
jgi:cyclophilin family peptidyl-prolyl cis-trans isomerase